MVVKVHVRLFVLVTVLYLAMDVANQVVIIHVSLPVKAIALQVVKMVANSQLREDSFKQYDSISLDIESYFI